MKTEKYFIAYNIPPQYYQIFIYNNEIATVEKIDEEVYNYLKDIFEYVYHTKNGDTYQLHKKLKDSEDIIIADDDHLYELLDDLREQGFCETIKLSFIDDYFNGNYIQYGQAF